MTDLVEYFRRLEQIVGDTTPDDQITFHFRWNSFDEAKQLIRDIRRMQKEIRLLKKQLLLEQSGVRSQFTAARSAVGKNVGSLVLGALVGFRSVGSGNAYQRESIRVHQHKAMASYEEMKSLMDRLILKLESVKGQVEMSEECRQGKTHPGQRPPPLPAPAQQPKFWTFFDDKVKGPFSIEQISGFLTAKLLNDTSLICYDGSENWVGLYEVPELSGLL